MATQTEIRVYEAMFVVDPAVAAMWDDLNQEIRTILGRQNAEIVGITRWDERKLAFPVKKQKRGSYVLAFFTLPDPEGVSEIERDCRLSDQILRVLVVRADQFTVADMRIQLGEDVDETVATRLVEARGETEQEEEAEAPGDESQAQAEA